MLLIDSGTRDAKNFGAKIHFARQLANRGHKVIIDETTVPEQMNRTQKYEAVRFLGNVGKHNITRLLIIGAETVSDDLLRDIHGYNLNASTRVTAIGRFTSQQLLISTQSKIAYSLGYEPEILDLSQLQPKPIIVKSISPMFAGTVTCEQASNAEPKLFLLIPEATLDDPQTLPMLGVLSNIHGFHCSIVTSAKGKGFVKKSLYSVIPTYGYSELSPDTLAKMADIAVFFGPGVPGEKMAAFALDLLRCSGVVIDCTDSASLVTSGAPIIRGPQDLNSLSAFIQSSILSNRDALGIDAAQHPWLQENYIEKLEQALELDNSVGCANDNEGENVEREQHTVFIPTNGVGLGHAQRCSLIASAMQQPYDVLFAAFPSCVPMLQSKGFDCLPLIQKSDLHSASYSNDILNYSRLSNLFHSGDKLIFDGGYVFDSIYYTILEKQLSAIWIRRGLWQPGQINLTPLDREHAFKTVIVPEEAFDELNSSYSFGDHVKHVGPIVQGAAMTVEGRIELRNRLKKIFNHDFEKLVVTMLGGGVAADRSAQMQSLCAQFHGRTDCLHLIVVWPNALISPGLNGWDNSYVVKTQNALKICQASDLMVSAVGYNSFHEALYHQIPAIFIPQMAAYMDDQERRARAASERGYAVTVLSSELLMLEREVAAFIDDGKAEQIRQHLKTAELPELGNHAAATLIEGIS